MPQFALASFALIWLAACNRAASPSFELDPSLEPGLASIDAPWSSTPRPVAALGHPEHALDFVENEAVVALGPGDDADQIAARMGGTVVRRIDLGGTRLDASDEDGLAGFALVRVDAAPQMSGGDLDRLARRAVRDGRDEAGGELRVSSQPGLDLLGAVGRESLDHDVQASINFLVQPAGLSERETQESLLATDSTGLSATWTSNAFDWPYMSRGGALDIGAAEAARLVRDAGRNPTSPSDRVEVVIIDGGFASTADLTFSEVIPGDALDRPNPYTCAAGNVCPWHGTRVASAMAGTFDDMAGAAGPAADVAYPVLLAVPGANLWDWLEFFFVTLPQTAARQPPLLNMSGTADIPAGACLLGICTLADIIAAKVRASGTLVVAAAGNDGVDVDAEDCFFACWEETYRFPCEAPGVLCVGGLELDEPTKVSQSAFGSDSRSSRDSVDLYAPYYVWVHDDPAGGTTRATLAQGTSYSAPFVTSIAALLLAADPFLSPVRIEDTLLSTAHTAASGPVHRWINAYGAVTQELGNAPPFVRIRLPIEGTEYPWQASSIPLECEVDDEDPASLQTRWISDRDGVLSTYGPRANVPTTMSLGRHDLHCEISDGPYTVSSTPRRVQIVNNDPTVDLVLPTFGATPYAGQPIQVRARASDVNANLQDVSLYIVPITGAGLAWEADDVTLSSQLGTADGVVPPGTLQAGGYEVVVNASDDRGRFGGATTRITVLESPDNLPPTLLGTSISAVPAFDPSDVPSRGRYRVVDCITDVNGGAAGTGFCRRLRFDAEVWDDEDSPSSMAWSWTIATVSAPSTPIVTSTLRSSLTADLEVGTYVVRLAVTDSEGAVSSSDVGVWDVEVTSAGPF